MNKNRLCVVLLVVVITVVLPGTSAAQRSSAAVVQTMIDDAQPGALLEIPFDVYDGAVTIE